MVYRIERSGNGYKVCDDKMKCFSKKGLPLKTARKQRIAIALSEANKTGKAISNYFA